MRRLQTWAASDNLGSFRVLDKAAFGVIGTEMSSVPARAADIPETIPRLA